VFKAEGQEQIDAFLQRQALPASTVDAGSPRHLLPLVDNEAALADMAASGEPPACDGFFYALLHKPQPA
jgi:16S rRNA (cytosine967-C5)-methyltransferase